MKLTKQIDNDYYFENEAKEIIHITADSLEQAKSVLADLEKLNSITDETRLKRKLLNQVKQKAKELLSSTDYKITRHEEQLKIGTETSLTDIEFSELLTERNNIRLNSNKFEAEIEALNTLEELNNYKFEY